MRVLRFVISALQCFNTTVSNHHDVVVLPRFLSCMYVPQALDNTDPPPNDQCTQPLPLTLSAPSINGNSTWARPHGLHNADCSLQPYTRGLFYSITGTGTTLELTWTTTAAAISNGRFEIAIMSEACRRCVQSSDFLLAEDVPFVTTFDTVEDLDYVILVSGQGFGDVGAFTLQIKVCSMWRPARD